MDEGQTIENVPLTLDQEQHEIVELHRRTFTTSSAHRSPVGAHTEMNRMQRNCLATAITRNNSKRAMATADRDVETDFRMPKSEEPGATSRGRGCRLLRWGAVASWSASLWGTVRAGPAGGRLQAVDAMVAAPPTRVTGDEAQARAGPLFVTPYRQGRPMSRCTLVAPASSG